MKINTQTAATAAAFAFAAFAAWFVLRGPGKSAIALTGTDKRGADLLTWYDANDLQAKSITGSAPGFYVDTLKRRGIL